ncbi:MAG: hypothetical protein ACFKPT_32015 [Gloeotrichia echinulata GP01]
MPPSCLIFLSLALKFRKYSHKRTIAGDWGLGTLRQAQCIAGDWGLGTLRQAQCIAGDWGHFGKLSASLGTGDTSASSVHRWGLGTGLQV